MTDSMGRIKITERDREVAIIHAIVNSTSPLKITPGMWQALRPEPGPGLWAILRALFTRKPRCWVHQTVDLRNIRCELPWRHPGWHKADEYLWKTGSWYTRVRSERDT
jgi:hypothetical protein